MPTLPVHMCNLESQFTLFQNDSQTFEKRIPRRLKQRLNGSWLTTWRRSWIDLLLRHQRLGQISNRPDSHSAVHCVHLRPRDLRNRCQSSVGSIQRGQKGRRKAMDHQLYILFPAMTRSFTYPYWYLRQVYDNEDATIVSKAQPGELIFKVRLIVLPNI